MASVSAANSGYFFSNAENSAIHSARNLAPRGPSLALKSSRHLRRNQELSVLRPAVASLRRPDFLLAERLTVRRAGVLFGRRSVADVAIDDNQRRPIRGLLEVSRTLLATRSRSLALDTRSTFQP